MDISKIRLFSTHEHSCSYLEDQQATTLFVDPTLRIDKLIYSELSDFGFRRSGRHLYRPKCQSCKACIPIRIPVNSFKANRSQRRCLKKNQHVTTSWSDSINSDEHYQLYERYIHERHADGDMFPPSREQYDDFLSAQWGVTQYVEFRLENKLIGVAVCDTLEKGLSAIYTFFEPQLHSRSLGVLAVLRQIELCQQLGLPYLYLGYWIRNCQKMNYKIQYRPLQLYTQHQWINLS